MGYSKELAIQNMVENILQCIKTVTYCIELLQKFTEKKFSTTHLQIIAEQLKDKCPSDNINNLFTILKIISNNPTRICKQTDCQRFDTTIQNEPEKCDICMDNSTAVENHLVKNEDFYSPKI